MRTAPKTSFFTLIRSTTKTIRSTRSSVRLIAVVALVSVATLVLGSTKSSATVFKPLFARAAAIFAKAPEARANVASSTLHSEDQAEPEAVAPSTTMSVERRGHTATRLNDGRVLIAGGENSSGALNESEIYDPANSEFSTSGNLNAARTDHTATLLSDGRVLIAGGRNGAGALNSTEIFDPATGAFTSGPNMSVARAGHTATLFADGRILFAGGDGNGSAEILSADLSETTAVGSLGTARSMHSAALLQDGRVLVVGGRDADGKELSSGEVFDTPAGTFSAVDGSLKVSRVRALLRVLFDGKVQIIGGNNDASMEVYDPQVETFGAYVHVQPEGDTCVGLPAQVQAAQTRAALFHNGQTDPTFDRSEHSITELTAQAIVIGGVNSGGSELSSTPIFTSSNAAISTDKLDYSPGETVNITGRGFQAGETVRIKVHEDPHTPLERGLDVIADADGNFVGQYVVQQSDLYLKFLVGARGLTSGLTAQTSFTDAFKADLQGQSNPPCISGGGCTPPWQTGNLTGWQEQVPIPTRVHMTGGPVTNQPIVVQFDHTKTSGGAITPGIQDLTGFVAGTGVSMTTPVLTGAAGIDVWSYSFNVTLTGSDGDVTFNTTMAVGANNFSGSSLALSGTPALGTLQIAKPAPVGTADLSVTKTGPSSANPSQTISYTLAYLNKATSPNAAANTQITDTLPAGLSYVAGSCTAGCTFNSATKTLTWNLGTLAIGAGGSVTFQATVTAAVGANVTNTALIQSSASDPNLNDNDSSVTTNITAACTAASVTTQPTNQTVTYGAASASFTAAASGTPTPTIQWQVSSGGGPFTDLSNNTTYSGVTTGTLTISNPTVSLSGNQYRAVFTNTCGGTQTANSNAATLTVNPKALTVTPKAVSTSYTGVALNNTTYSDNTSNYSITGFVNSETVVSAGITLSGSMAFNGSTSTVVKNVGTYTQAVGTLSMSSTGGNYSMSFTNPTPNNYVITAASLTVTPNAVSTTYNGVALDNTAYSDNTSNYSITGFVNSETVVSAGITLSGSMAFNGSTSTMVKNVGTYTQGVGTLTLNSTNNNYSMTFSNPTPNNYVITRAHLTVTADNKSKTYDGNVYSPFTATISGFVNGETEAGLRAATALSGNPGFTGTAITAVNASATPYTITPTLGSLTATNYDFTPFNDGALTINQADAVINVNGYTGVYDGNAHGATGTAVGVESPTPANLNSLLHLGASFTNVPGGTAHWTFDGNTNYKATAGDVAITITQADAVINVNGYTGVYDGNAHGATGTAVGVESPTPANLNSLLHLGASFTNVPGGTAHWTFDGNTNYKATAGDVAITITQANAVINVNGYTGVYDGNAHGATGTAVGVESPTPANLNSLLHLGASFTNVPGGTAHWTFDGNTNYKATAGDVAITITQANAVINVNGYTGVYDGNAHGATGTAVGVESPTPANLNSLLHLGASFMNVPGGTAHWTFDGNTNYKATAGDVAITITQADAVINVNGYTGVYDGNAHGATGTAVGVESPTPANLNGLLHLGASFTNVPGGTAHWTFDGNTNYKAIAGDVAITISQANQIITWNNPLSIVYGTALSTTQLNATVAGVAGGSAPGALTYTPAAGTVLNAGNNQTLAVDAAATTNYYAAHKEVKIDVSQAVLTITADDKSKIYGANNPPFTFTPSGFVNGDIATTAFTGTPALNSIANASSSFGTYPVTAAVGTLVSSNYSFDFHNGTLTINRANTATAAADKTAAFGSGSVMLSAAVTNTSNPPSSAVVNEGTVTFNVKSGLTLLSTIAGTVSGGSATASLTLGPSYVLGTYTIEAVYSDGVSPANFNGSSDAIANTLTITTANTNTALSVSTPVQYSDPVTFAATVTPTTLNGQTISGTVQFCINGSPVGGANAVNTSTGVASYTFANQLAAGSYTVTAKFTSTNANFGNSNSNSATLLINKEDADLEYSGDTLKSTGSTASNSTTSLQMAAVVREAVDSNLGDKLNTTQIKFTIYKFTDTTFLSPVATCTGNVAATGPGTGSATCTLSNVGADNYVVKMELLDNAYYAAQVEDVAVTVVLSGTGFTTGGGWLTDPNLGTRSNFGFTVKFLKNANIQGNSLYIYRRTITANSVANPSGGYLPAGTYNWIIKSNSMGGLTQTCTTTTPTVCTASFSGKNNITAVNRATGVAYSLGGNYNFQVDVTDASEPGSSPGAGPDKYALRVWDTSTGTYYQLGAPTAQLQIIGGNIQVRP